MRTLTLAQAYSCQFNYIGRYSSVVGRSVNVRSVKIIMGKYLIWGLLFDRSQQLTQILSFQFDADV